MAGVPPIVVALIAGACLSLAEGAHAQFSGGGKSSGGWGPSSGSPGSTLPNPGPIKGPANPGPFELKGKPGEDSQLQTFKPAGGVDVAGNRRLRDAESFNDAVHAAGALQVLPAAPGGFDERRFSAGNRDRIKALLKEIGHHRELQAGDVLRAQKVEQLKLSVSQSLYAEAVSRGVIDPGMLGPDPDGALRDLPSRELIERWRRLYPEPKLVGLLGNRGGIGGGCRYCIPNPASPVPSSGLPPGTPLPSLGSKPPVIVTNPGKVVTDETNRRPESADPLGFTDVVLLEGQGSDRGLVCSGTRVTETKIITAAHCISGVAALPADAINRRLSVQVPRLSAEAYALCMGEIQKTKLYRYPCVAFDAARIERVVMHPRYVAGRQDAPARNDIAVLTISLPGTNAQRRRADPDYSTPLPTAITLAGYGHNLLPNRRVDVLEVGWNAGKVWGGAGDGFRFDPNDPALSGACYGDSGGPVFRDRVNGRQDEPHRLVAVISAGKTDAECKGEYWVATTKLSDPEVRDFLQPALAASDGLPRLAASRP